MKYDSIIFDLDGTLADSAEPIARAWNKAAPLLGIKKRVTSEEIQSVMGYPIEKCVEILLGEEAEKLKSKVEIAKFEKKFMSFKRKMIFDGVLELIPRLAERYRLFIVSNCLGWYLENFLDVSGLRDVLEDWDCYGMSGMAKEKMIMRIVEKHGLENPVYVGDTDGDEKACRIAGVDFIFAEYGFGKCSGEARRIGSFGELEFML